MVDNTACDMYIAVALDGEDRSIHPFKYMPASSFVLPDLPPTSFALLGTVRSGSNNILPRVTSLPFSGLARISTAVSWAVGASDLGEPYEGEPCEPRQISSCLRES